MYGLELNQYNYLIIYMKGYGLWVIHWFWLILRKSPKKLKSAINLLLCTFFLVFLARTQNQCLTSYLLPFFINKKTHEKT
jgi:hypothetical protein